MSERYYSKRTAIQKAKQLSLDDRLMYVIQTKKIIAGVTEDVFYVEEGSAFVRINEILVGEYLLGQKLK